MVKANRSERRIDQDDKSFLESSANSFQENVTRSAPLAPASYSLVGAILLLGGIGYAIDRWRGTAPWFLLAGLLLGIVVGFYELAMAVRKPASKK